MEDKKKGFFFRIPQSFIFQIITQLFRLNQER